MYLLAATKKRLFFIFFLSVLIQTQFIFAAQNTTSNTKIENTKKINSKKSPKKQFSQSNSSVSIAKIDDLMVTCDEIDRNLTTGESELKGNVQIIYKDRHLSADKVIIHQKEKTALLIGQVVIKNSQYEIGGKQVQLNYETNSSVINDGYVKSNNIIFTGSMIEQKDGKDFYVLDANYTTCSNCPATWSFDGSKIEAQLGGYAFIKNTFIRVSGIPVFWLPYLIVPLKNERQTGLLTPEIGYFSQRRLTYSQSLFIAFDQWHDATINLTNYEIGGLKKSVEYRYALKEKSFGDFTISHINDSLFTSNKRYTYFTDPDDQKSKFNRWSLRSTHQYQWSEFDKLTFDLNQVSDLDYPKDFYDEFPNYANSGLENRLNYTARSDISTTSLSAIYYRHLLSANTLADNSMAVHQLPEIKFDTTINQIQQSQLFYKFGLTYTNFYRDKKYDDISFDGSQRYVTNNSASANPSQCENLLDGDCSLNQDGTYDSNQDIIRSGQRLNYSATLLTPASTIFNSINISPEISYNETHYLFPVGDNQYRAQRYLEFDVLSRSKLYRIFESSSGNSLNPSAFKYKHEFIPELSYRWIPWYQHDQHPFFGVNADGEIPVVSRNIITDADLASENKIQFDYEDRIYDRNLITLNLINRVIEKNNSTSIYKNVFDIQIRQSYDIFQSYNGKNKNEPLSDLSSTANLYLNEYILTNQTNYFPYQSATNSSTTLTYINSLQQYFKLGYSSKQTGEPKQDDVSVSLGFVTAYLNLLTGVVLDTSENRQSDSRVKKVSLITQIKPPGECWAINLYRNQKVGSEAEWKFNFEWSFDGKPTKVIPPQELNIN